MINKTSLPGSQATFSARKASLVPRNRRGRIVSFDSSTWKAVVQLDGALAAVKVKVGDWVNPAALTAGALVAVVLFNDSNPNDGLVVGTYGTVGGRVFSDAEGDPAPVGTAADGTSTYSARRDHIHGGGGRGATLFVAAADASALVRAQADYVCDGTADEVQINAALAALPAPGGAVLLSEGTFTLANTVSLPASNITLAGQGRGTLVRITAAVAGKHIINAPGTSGAHLTGVCVRDLRVQGYGDDAGSTQDHGIRFAYVDKGIIHNIWGSDCTFAVVQLHDCTYCIVDTVFALKGSLGTNGGWYGVTAWAGDLSGYAAYHSFSRIVSTISEHNIALNLCDHCNLANIVATGITNDYAVNITGCEDVTLDGFSFDDCDGAFFAEASVSPARNCARCIVANGTLTGPASSQYGVDIRACPRTVIENVILVMTGQTAGHGIKLDVDSDYSAVVNCKVYDAYAHGVYVENGNNNTAVTGCECYSCGSAGIFLGSGLQARCFGNHCELNGTDGINVGGKQSQIFGNVCLSNTSDGIAFDYGDDNVISGNVCMSNGAYGIYSSVANSERNVVTANVVRSNTSGQISIAGGQSAGNENLVYRNSGYVTERSGAAATVADGGTITHGLAATPTNIRCTPSVAGEMIAVTATSSTTFTVAIKKHDGTAGTTQTVYWEAEV